MYRKAANFVRRAQSKLLVKMFRIWSTATLSFRDGATRIARMRARTRSLDLSSSLRRWNAVSFSKKVSKSVRSPLYCMSTIWEVFFVYTCSPIVVRQSFFVKVLQMNPCRRSSISDILFWPWCLRQEGGTKNDWRTNWRIDANWTSFWAGQDTLDGLLGLNDCQ